MTSSFATFCTPRCRFWHWRRASGTRYRCRLRGWTGGGYWWCARPTHGPYGLWSSGAGGTHLSSTTLGSYCRFAGRWTLYPQFSPSHGAARQCQSIRYLQQKRRQSRRQLPARRRFTSIHFCHSSLASMTMSLSSPRKWKSSSSRNRVQSRRLSCYHRGRRCIRSSPFLRGCGRGLSYLSSTGSHWFQAWSQPHSRCAESNKY